MRAISSMPSAANQPDASELQRITQTQEQIPTLCGITKERD
jgi:hypothetical protein